MREVNLRPRFLNRILFTDEAIFGRDGPFNSRNTHVWAEENPHAMHIRNHQDRFSVNVWAGIIDGFIVGPYLLPQRLTGEMYNTFLNEVLLDLLENIPYELRQRMWYQHDGAPPHSTRVVQATLISMFPRRWIGRGGPRQWTPRSPDFNPLDYFFWGLMRSLVYKTTIQSPEDLVARIVAAAGEIAEDQAMIRKTVTENMVVRARACIAEEGRQFEPKL